MAQVEIDLLALECFARRAAATADAGTSSVLKLRGSDIEETVSDLGRLAMGSGGRLDQSATLEDPGLVVLGPSGGPD